jgi:heme exporter protein CcmD
MFESFSAFLEMGGYGAFIWGSYAVCFGLLGALTWQSVHVWRRRRRELEALQGSRRRTRTD